MKTLLKIDGMSCDHCVKHVKDALEEISGVKSAKVSLKDNSADVEHDAAVTLAAMKEAVTEAGYEVV
ncbi:mercuric reductase [Spirochaetia bacterium]|nr:mercuric reductase [Spirochaetia bacterium]GHU77914.1 mercuric reductase [Spirochaetia bacterium]GHU89306.1 mercuric reductase [Spirochaetia bacterium]